MSTAVIIGYGRMGREHERAYQECGVDVVMRCNSEAIDYVKSLKPDYVSVCSHDDSHAEYICAALEAGCNVIAEKPLCLNEDDLRDIYKYFANGRNIACNLPLLHLDWPDASDSGFIRCGYIWGRADQIPKWRSACPGYSFVLGAGIHMASLLLKLKGRAIKDVRARGQKTRADIDCETVIEAEGSFVGGGDWAMEINCGTNEPHRHYLRIEDRGVNVGHRPTDKTAEIKRFIREGHGNHMHVFAAHSVCFAIERALKSGKREYVEYLTWSTSDIAVYSCRF